MHFIIIHDDSGRHQSRDFCWGHRGATLEKPIEIRNLFITGGPNPCFGLEVVDNSEQGSTAIRQIETAIDQQGSGLLAVEGTEMVQPAHSTTFEYRSDEVVTEEPDVYVASLVKFVW